MSDTENIVAYSITDYYSTGKIKGQPVNGMMAEDMAEPANWTMTLSITNRDCFFYSAPIPKIHTHTTCEYDKENCSAYRLGIVLPFCLILTDIGFHLSWLLNLHNFLFQNNTYTCTSIIQEELPCIVAVSYATHVCTRLTQDENQNKIKFGFPATDQVLLRWEEKKTYFPSIEVK